MAVITPNTDLYLLKCPLEIDEVNQLTFANKQAQYNYFNSLPKLAVNDFTYQRKDSTIRFGANFDDCLLYNYCMYRNTEYSDKWFYAYVSNHEYINDSVTAVTIKTDVWQTWQFDLEYKPVFVEREHVNDDTIGANTVPESVELGEYIINDLVNIPLWETSLPSTDWYVCFCVTGFPSSAANITADGRVYADSGSIGGVFSSLKFFAVNTFQAASEIIKAYDDDGTITADAIKNLYMVPSCCVNRNATGAWSHIGVHTLYPLYNYYESDEVKYSQPQELAGDYHPVNNKLFTYPYSYFYLTNKVGEEVTYHYEDFPVETVGTYTGRTITTQIAIVPSTSLSAKLYLAKYKDYSDTAAYGTKMYNYGVNFAKVPVCAWTTDYYTNWLTQNGVNVATNAITGTLNSALSLGMGIAGGNPQGIASGAIGLAGTIGNTIGQLHAAEVTPPQAHGDINTGDFIYSFTRCAISMYHMSIRPEMARIVDNYFSQFGYKINRVKLPNITGRRNWNYVKTIGCYIHADIPQLDLEEIKSMFNRGVTFWHNPNTFADYSQNNDII